MDKVKPVHETVEIMTQAQIWPGRWQPNIGPEAIALLQQIPDRSRESIKDEALAVLSRCIPPNDIQGHETGIVIGYVQSGKTMSFTTVSALAQDNNYQIIIVITGTSINLFNQSNDRLKLDLRLSDRGRKWKLFSSDKFDKSAFRSIQSALARWKDSTVLPADRQTVLITVMKQRAHLDRLIKLLSNKNIDLCQVPTLIIDDEADQAGLNNLVRKDDESATYRRLIHLRECLPHHTFLQYTATPQAPLLINLIDALSPKFVEVLTPGHAYTGGKTFFVKETHLLRPIPDDHVPTKHHIIDEPPESLLEAMRIFLLGTAAGMLLRTAPDNRSMMIHPSKETTKHADYYRWVDLVMKRWQNTLKLPEKDPDRRDLLMEFEVAYKDLQATVHDLQPFENLLSILERAIRETDIREVNTRQQATPIIDWKQNYAYILVGGQALDRGYTVEGLTVTYMPRGQGVGNADTFQQRARWFGYKAGYIGYCRVYLSQETRSAYEKYVAHEENIREQMRKYCATGEKLDEWRRAFFLSPDMQPTRRDVLSLDYMRGNYAKKWWKLQVPHESDDATEMNREVVKQFLTDIKLHADENDKSQKRYVASDVSLSTMYQDLLLRFRVTHPSDSQRFTGLLLQLSRYVELHPQELCTIYYMGERKRSVNDQSNEIKGLFQGRHTLVTGEVYRDDESVYAKQGLTIQIYYFTLYLGNVGSKGSKEIVDNVPTIAVRLSKDMSANWISQEQIKA